MTTADTPGDAPLARLDLETLADHGPSPPSPCAVCDRPTRSHILVEVDHIWRGVDDRSLVDDVTPGTVVRFAILCHTCRTDLSLPGHKCPLDVDVLARPAPNSSSIFRAVVA